ncbi:MAG: SMP-30/gluconolactonase/LRE family protein, partial [Planctomycetia bacterium]|nr:SMP-30/gluconolactonase/LRE family protein [Planctomycetia bacterium]
AFSEGPAYSAKTGSLYFVEVGDREGRVWQIDSDGKMGVYVKTGSPANNSAVIGPDGAVYIAQNSTKKVLRIGADGKATEAASNYGPAEIPGPNDLAFRADGSFYFTCPDWSGRKDKVIGSVFFVPKTGKPREVAKGLAQPNGIGLSPDGKTLYVALTGADKILSYSINADGTLGEARTLVQFDKGAAPDGMAVGGDGTIYQTLHVAGEVVALDASGEELARLEIGQTRVTNCTLGPDGTLYITLVSKSDSDAAVISVQALRH